MLTDSFNLYKSTPTVDEWGFTVSDTTYSTTPTQVIKGKLINTSTTRVNNNSEPYISNSGNLIWVYQAGEPIERGDKLMDLDTETYYICGKPKPIRRSGGTTHHMEVTLAIEDEKQ